MNIIFLNINLKKKIFSQIFLSDVDMDLIIFKNCFMKRNSSCLCVDL